SLCRAAQYVANPGECHRHQYGCEAGLPDDWYRSTQGQRRSRGERDAGYVHTALHKRVILGGLLVLLCYRVRQGRRARQERQRDIDRLTEQFQALFRESDQGKHHYSYGQWLSICCWGISHSTTNRALTMSHFGGILIVFLLYAP